MSVSVLIENTKRSYIDKLLAYVYIQYKDTITNFELRNVKMDKVMCDGDDHARFEYIINLFSKTDSYDININGNIIKIYNISEDHYKMNDEGIFHKNIRLCITGSSLDIINELFKRCWEYWDSVSVRTTNTMKINILRFDYTCWECAYKSSKRPIDTVILPIKIKNSLTEDLTFFKSDECRKKYNSLSLTHTRTYMFYGLPGTGKTSMVRAIATQFDMSIAIVDFDSDMDDKRLRNCIQRLPKNTILLLEDIDCLFKARLSREDDNSNVTFSGLLNALDGVIQNDDTLVIITTNHLEKIDNALKRRIDLFVNFTFANKEQVRGMYMRFFPDLLNKFEMFYENIKHFNVTTNVLQKFFSKYLFKDITEYVHELATFMDIDEKKPDMYT